MPTFNADSKYEFVFENDDNSLVEQQKQIITDRKERKLALKAKEKEEQQRFEADNQVRRGHWGVT